MKKLILTTLLTFLSVLFLYSQEGKWEWARLFESVGAIVTDSWGMDMYMDADNNVYITGVFRNIPVTIGTETLTNRINYDVFICSFDADGNFRWAKSIASDQIDDIAGLVVDGNDLYIAGAFNGPTIYFTETDSLNNSVAVSPYNYDSYIAHYQASDGEFLGAKMVFWGTNNQRLQDMTLDHFNNYLVVVGQFTNQLIYNNGIQDTTITPLGTKDFVIARFGLSGGFDNLKFNDFQRFYGNNNSTSLKQVNLSVIGSNRTGYFISGDLFGTLSFSPTQSITGSSTTSADALVIKIDNNLNYVWSRRGGGTAYDHVNSSGSDDNGNIYLAGKFHGIVTFDSTATLQSASIMSAGLQDLYIAKYNREGRLLWIYHYGYAGNDDAFGMAILGNYLQIAGNVSETGSTNTGFIKLDLAGNYVNKGETYGSGEDVGKAIVFDNEGNTYIAGYFNSTELFFGPQGDPDTSLINVSGTYDGFAGKYEYPLTIVQEEVIDVTCHGGNNGYIRVRGEFGVPPYTWSWEHESNTTPVADSLTAGTYIVTLTDYVSNVVKDTIVITEPTALVINRFINDVSCYNGNDGSINVSVSGGIKPYSYLWSGGSGLDPTNDDQDHLKAGTYYLQLTDDNGCILDSTFIITQPPQLVISELKKWDVSPCSASNGSVKVIVTGGTPVYSYLWSNDETTDSIGSLTKGDYSVKVTDANNCSVTSPIVTIIDSCQVNLLVLEVHDVSCHNGSDGSIILSAYGGARPYTYSGTPDLGLNDSVAENLAVGNYEIIVMDNIGDSDTINVQITQPAVLFASAKLTDVTCFGESTGRINLTVSGGTPPYSHKWYPNGENTEDLTNIPFGNYIDTIMDANGCILVKNYTLLHLNTEIKIKDPVIDSVSCIGLNDGTIDITVEGGVSPYSYYWLEKEWDPKDGLINQDIEDLFLGEYRVEVTDDSGCVKIDTFYVFEPGPMQILTDSVKPSCPGRDDGKAWIHAIGGNGGYTYLWEPSGKTGDFVEEMPTLTYDVTITDKKQCQAVDTVIIPENNAITVNLDLINNILCTDSVNGDIFITTGGGTPPYSWLWFPDGETTEDIMDKPAGNNYSVTVTDDANCSKISDNFEIEDQSLPINILSLDTFGIRCFGLNNGKIVIKADGKIPFNYSIDNGLTYQIDTLFENLIAGFYSPVVKDANGCLKYLNTLEIKEPAELMFFNIDSIWNQELSMGTINISMLGGIKPYKYHITGGNDEVDTTNSEGSFVNFLEGGHYLIQVTDNRNCEKTAAVYALITEKLFTNTGISLYPNPTTGKLTVEIEARDHKDINLEILNMLGQVIWKKDLQYNGQPRFVEEIDLSKQSKGTYFMRVNGLAVDTKILIE